MSDNHVADLGYLAYQAYGQAVDYKNYQGLPMPLWEDLSEKIREAWIAAAKAVFEASKNGKS